MLPAAILGAGALQAGTSLIGGAMSAKANKENAARNEALQREFAQMGVQWKVADAKAAGIHPLYALGAQTHSFAPISVGDTSMGSALAQAGQDIGGAISRTASPSTKDAMVARTLQGLQLEGAKLDNELKSAELASKVARLKQDQSASLPIPPVGPFVVPESKKADERNPLMLNSNRVLTDPGTSPGKAWEDVLGDDIFSPGFLPNLWGMIKSNTQGMSFLDILRALDRKTRMW